jgi:hypothetical protein
MQVLQPDQTAVAEANGITICVDLGAELCEYGFFLLIDTVPLPQIWRDVFDENLRSWRYTNGACRFRLVQSSEKALQALRESLSWKCLEASA